jgi:hypothetical protein
VAVLIGLLIPWGLWSACCVSSPRRAVRSIVMKKTDKTLVLEDWGKTDVRYNSP